MLFLCPLPQLTGDFLLQTGRIAVLAGSVRRVMLRC